MRPVGQDRLRPCSDATRRCSAVYANRIRLRSNIGKEAMRRRAEEVERSFAHTLERGGMQQPWLRGRENVRKRSLIHGAGHNLGLMMHLLIGAGTPEAAARRQSVLFVLRTRAMTLFVIPSEADVLVLSAIHTAWMH